MILLSSAWCFAQNVLIRGKAHPSYGGKVIRLSVVADYVTNTRQHEASDTIDTDGYFEVGLHSDITRPVFLKIGNVAAQLYVQPEYVYGITFPEIEKTMEYGNDAELTVNIGIIGTDSLELNNLIFDYQELYNGLFIPPDGRFISRAMMFKLSDSLQKICSKRYSHLTNAYFKNYVDYSIASLNASVSRGENSLISRYILNKPVLYHHYEYMQFVDACFNGYLSGMASERKGQSLYNIINVKASYSLLYNFVKQDKMLNTDTLAELLILKNLWDFYFSADFAPDAIENIVGELSLQTQNQEHKRIAADMLAYFNKMQEGSPAPDFSARARSGKMGSLSAYKGKWVYLNFFSTRNTGSLKEMPKIAALKKKFGDKIVFLSVCLDDSLAAYNAYLKANPRFDWPIWFNNDKSLSKTAKESYFVTGTEAYFLISNFGYLAQSPAWPPSKGIEYKLNIIFKVRQRNTKTGIR